MALEIHAEIKDGDKIGYINIPIIIDPLTQSYSDFGDLSFYDLEISNVVGLTDISLLKNGKNSRFTSATSGTCNLKLTIKDINNNIDTDIITITIN